MSEQRVAVVTGISSGIGKATAQGLAESGFIVFGTVRSAQAGVPNGVEQVVLDVRDQASIDAAVTSVLSRAKRIDVLVNNAGSSILGAIEETETQEAQALFDVNFFGAVRVTKAVLPAMRAQRGGRILFISSILGFLPAPFMAFYSASKHALEGYAESLDHEVRTLGIRAILIEPGFMRSRLGQNSARVARHIPDYAGAGQRAADYVRTSLAKAEDPSIVAKAVLEAVAAARPRLRYPVGKNARLLARLRSLMPAPMFDRSLRATFGMGAS